MSWWIIFSDFLFKCCFCCSGDKSHDGYTKIKDDPKEIDPAMNKIQYGKYLIFT